MVSVIDVASVRTTKVMAPANCGEFRARCSDYVIRD